MGRLSLVVALVVLLTAGCSSVSICLEQEKGVSASEDARSQGCTPNRPTRSREREQEMFDGQDGAVEKPMIAANARPR
jgi:uncharacterized lipoprotein